MLVALGYAMMYVISFGAILILLASVVGLVCWLCVIVFRASARPLR